MSERMPGNYVLSDKKLTNEEFKKKYYVSDTNEEQYHTMHIEDGENERQQLLINNIRCLWNNQKRLWSDRQGIYEEVRDQVKNCKNATMSIVAIQIMICTATCLYITLTRK